jgi:FHA domain
VRARVVLSLDGEIVTEVELSKAVTVVGRHPTCDICIDHPAISSRHLLFRIVNATVYVEDLASTNGTKVNGLSTGHQVIHHLDLIEAGKHKLHFFDDAMLASGVANLETTVHTDFERTMLASHAPEAAKAQPKPAAADVDLSRTMAIPRESLRQGPMHEVVRTDEVAKPAQATPVPAAEALALRVQSGARVGEIIALEQANTMLGAAGSDTALVVRRGNGFYLARFGGNRPPRLNHQELGPGTHRLSPGDVVEVGGSAFEVMSVVR